VRWRKNVGAVQSRPIDNDPQFLTILDAINPLLARYGFPLVSYKGSASWRAGTTDPTRSTETYFKLIYRGRGKPFIFGIRKDFASEIGKLRSLRWPLEFSVMPNTEVPFVGFEFPPDEADLATQRVVKILRALPEPDPRLAIPLHDSSIADFDKQLDEL